MIVKKSDFTLIKEAESQGCMVAMTSTVERIRTELNKELSSYFKKSVPGFKGVYDEDEGEELLDSLNDYMKEKNIIKSPMSYPLSSGTEVELLPLTENIQLKLLISDEYNGGGDYSKYVMIEFFMINENATKEDVDQLIAFTNNYLIFQQVDSKPKDRGAIHLLKILPEYYQSVVSGLKTFEIRKNDRAFKVGDTLYLNEVQEGELTGNSVRVEIIYMTDYAQQENYVVLGIRMY